MITLYKSATGTFVSDSGANLSVNDMQLNILIELRVANLLAIELALGNAENVSLPGLRLDIVNDS